MVLSKCNPENSDLQVLKQYQIDAHYTTVVWTVCLAYVIKHFKVKHCIMYTMQKAITATYSTDIDTLQQVPWNPG